jgi:hypothetical protein
MMHHHKNPLESTYEKTVLTISKYHCSCVFEETEFIVICVHFAIANSSSKVQGTQEELKTTGSVIVQSRKLLDKYGRREFTDKVLLVFAFAFFLACVLYIIQKRLF